MNIHSVLHKYAEKLYKNANLRQSYEKNAKTLQKFCKKVRGEELAII